MENNTISVEVVYGLPEKQSLLTVSVPENSNVEAAIVASGILKLYSDIDLSTNKVGIWNAHVVHPTT